MRKAIFRAFVVLATGSASLSAQESPPTASPDAGSEIITVNFQPTDPGKKLPGAGETVALSASRSANPLGFWANADYLLWWVKGGPVPPIVTGSETFTDAPPGALGQPGTRVLFGDRSIDYGAFSGLRVGAGFDLADGYTLEASYFILQRRSSQFRVASDAAGNPLIGIAYFNTAIGLNDALLTANPDLNTGIWSGTATVSSHTRLQGWELNFGSPSRRRDGWSVKALTGLRILSLSEELTVHNEFQSPVAGILTFNGVGGPAGAVYTDLDRFNTGNTFYGGQIGARATWQQGALSLDVVSKIAFGANQQHVIIDGASTVTPAGGATDTTVGGIYAQTSNIGRYYKSTFAVVPEVGINLGWNLTDNCTVRVGYSFLYISRVARPGAQIDHGVNQTLVPTHQSFGLTAPDGRPAFAFRESDFWAQGINFGLEFRY